MKKRIALILSILLCTLLMGAAIPPAQVIATKGFYVNDYASMLFDSHRDDILALSTTLQAQTEIQVVVLTVKNLNGLGLETYAHSINQGWEIGGPGGKNGVLILVCSGERSSIVVVGENLAYLEDSLTSEIKVGDNNVSKSIMNVYRPLVSEIYKHNGIQPDETTQKMLDNPTSESSSPFNSGTSGP